MSVAVFVHDVANLRRVLRKRKDVSDFFAAAMQKYEKRRNGGLSISSTWKWRDYQRNIITSFDSFSYTFIGLTCKLPCFKKKKNPFHSVWDFVSDVVPVCLSLRASSQIKASSHTIHPADFNQNERKTKITVHSCNNLSSLLSCAACFWARRAGFLPGRAAEPQAILRRWTRAVKLVWTELRTMD